MINPAAGKLQYEAANAKAEGVVGVEIHEGSHGWETHVIDRRSRRKKIEDPIMLLSVND